MSKINCQCIELAVENACDICKDRFKFPYAFCCLLSCGEMEVCRGCDRGIYLKKEH